MRKSQLSRLRVVEVKRFEGHGKVETEGRRDVDWGPSETLMAKPRPGIESISTLILFLRPIK